jgi:leucyl aminopeptidase (aminopeptidase T)
VWCRQLTTNSTAQFYLGGVYDPTIFRKISPQKLAALEDGESASHGPYLKEGRVRTLTVGLGLVTPPRAKSYGFNFKAWKSMITAASNVNPDEIAKKAGEVIKRLQSAEKIKVTSPGHTDLEFSVKGRRLRVNDGVVDDRDMVEGAFNASIPAGSVETTILEDSANGQAVLDVPTPWAGRTIRRMKWEFQNGKVTAFDGDKNARELRKQWEIASGDKDRISMLTIGLNPNAKLGFMANELVEGTIGIGIGGNEDADGRNKRGFYFSGTIRKASLNLDGTTLVDRGKLRV